MTKPSPSSAAKRHKAPSAPSAPSSPSSLTLFLRPCAEILCLATHSKLGLTSFVEMLRARQDSALTSASMPAAIVDGGVIGLPLAHYLPPECDVSRPPSRIIILMHEKDNPQMAHALGQALSQYFLGVEIFFHHQSDPLE